MKNFIVNIPSGRHRTLFNLMPRTQCNSCNLKKIILNFKFRQKNYCSFSLGLKAIREKLSIFQENIFEIFLTNTLAKMSQNMHFLLYQNILSIFFLFLEKTKLYFLAAGVNPPPLADASTKNASFI